jgi:hypothetical protein
VVKPKVEEAVGYSGRVMLAVAGGYVLGRTKKMKLAIMLAGMASGNKLARDPAQLLQHGARLVQSSPQLSALSDQVRGRLIEAGKGIAVAVVSKQMESLSDRLSERTERLSGRLDEHIGSGPVGRIGHASGEMAPADEDHVDEWAEEDRAEQSPAEQDRTTKRAAQPRPRRTTARSSGGSPRSMATPSRKRDSASSTTNGSDNPASGTARKRAASGSQGGGRNA